MPIVNQVSMRTTDRLSSSSAHPKRSAVIQQLQDLNEENKAEQVSNVSSVSSSDRAGTVTEGSTPEVLTDYSQSGSNASFEEIRAWLDIQCEKEQAGVDWTSRHERRPNNTTHGTDVVCEGLDTAVLDRIRRGKGPRSAKFEDLLAPLRPGGAPKFHRRPIKETYKEMADVVYNWNMHVASAIEDTKAREALMNALCERISFLDRAVHNRWSADDHDDTCRKLLHAIYAYRPETADFETKDPTNLLIIILAHVRFAIPDIDDDLKYLIFFTLVTERLSSAHVANAARRQKLEDNIMDAKESRDTRRIKKYEKKMRDWISDGFRRESDIIADRIKLARRRIHLKALEDLQQLFILQTTQKLVVEETSSKPGDATMSNWWAELLNGCTTADCPVDKKTYQHLEDAITQCAAATEHISAMKAIHRERVLTRAIKFAGHDLGDIDEAERRRVVKQRMAHPDTARMMRDAVEGMLETKVQAEKTLGKLSKTEVEVETMLEAARNMFDEYERLDRVIEQDPRLRVMSDSKTKTRKDF